MEECEGKGKEVLVVMDTPERSKAQIATPISKFEESPVFNFLNSLSPIKPVKSVHITQTLNALSFSSLPSVFTSPHASSVKESRFLRRHQLVDPAKPEFSSDSRTKNDDDDKILDHGIISKQQDNVDSGNSSSQVNVEASYECSELTADFVRCLDYDCSSPPCSPKKASARGIKRVVKFNGHSVIQGPVPESASGFGNERNMDEMCRRNQGEEPGERDWESLIADASDLLNFDSPQDAYRKSLTPATGFYKSMHNVQQSEQGEGDETENPSTQPGEGGSQENDYVDGTNSQKMDAEPISHMYRGMRRRCLVFEMSGGRRKHLDEKASSTSMVLQSDGNTPSTERQKHPTRTGNDSKSSRCILPGIGLHLNAIAAASKDSKAGKNDGSVPGRLVITPNFCSARADQESYHHQSLSLTSVEPNSSPAENGGLLMEDLNQSSAMVLYDDESNLNSNSPKMKKRRLEPPVEPEACKRCNCKKSKCLKLYCECFAAGVYCVEPCSCQDCFNKPIHEDTVLATRKQIESRNPLAFAPKVIRGSNAVAEDDLTQTPASARHKRGCNCKKSGCLKKYCECYQGGVGCSINCRCEGCKNAFGRKDGSVYMETEVEDEEMEERSLIDRNKQKVGMHIDSEHATPATPLRFTRPSILHPFSSKKKPPRSSLASIGTSAGVYSIPGIVKPPLLQPQTQPRFDKQFETVQEDDELPDFLLGNTSPTPNIKSTSSPNSKRVSPPHSELGMSSSSSSPSRRSSRKLILQSIPAFPSLTPQH